MKARKTCLYYLLVLVTAIMLSGCSRYNPPVESFQSSETQPVQLPGQEEGGNGEGGQTDKNSGKDAATVQAEFNTFTDRVSGKLSVLILSISTLWSDTLKTTELKHRR